MSARASRAWRRWGQAVGKCPDARAARRKQQTAAARLAREARTRQTERDAAHFQVVMGVEGEGHITLAPGLEDVSVAFRKRRRVNWRPAGRRNRRSWRRAAAEAEGSDGGGRVLGARGARMTATLGQVEMRRRVDLGAGTATSRRRRVTMATAAEATSTTWWSGTCSGYGGWPSGCGLGAGWTAWGGRGAWYGSPT